MTDNLREELTLMPEQRKTIPEQFDAARSGEEFRQVLDNLFGALDRARAQEDEDGDDGDH